MRFKNHLRYVIIITVLVFLNVGLYGNLLRRVDLTVDCRADRYGMFCAIRQSHLNHSVQLTPGGLSVWRWNDDKGNNQPLYLIRW